MLQLKKFPLSNLQEAVLISVVKLSLDHDISTVDKYAELLKTFNVLELTPENCVLKKIIEFLQECGVKISTGSAYTTLKRLVDKKFLKEHKTKPQNKRGGKSTSYYSITKKGIKKLQEVDFIRDCIKIS